MNGMTTFMDHGGYIIQLSCSIHENKWCSTFRKGAVITTGCFSFTAIQVKVTHCFHLAQAICKEGTELTENPDGFIYQLFSSLKRMKRLHTFRFSVNIPGT